jgi:uncharacterized protein involved in tolerance to divalent cations
MSFNDTMNTQPAAIFVNIPCETKEEAQKLCGALLEKELCGTAFIKENTHLMYTENGKAMGDDVVLMSLKTTPQHLKEIETYIMANHSWGTPCVDAVPIIVDHC